VTDQLRPIETVYRGNRFRSRLEARWAVFFDAVGIEWIYEPDGFMVNGRGYLPDFWLPRFKCFAEVKPDKGTAKQAEPLLRALSTASGHRAILLIGQPADQASESMCCFTGEKWPNWLRWRECIFCGAVLLTGLSCPCSDKPGFTYTIIRAAPADNPRILHACKQAQQARFEHGETGEPKPFKQPPIPGAKRLVYVAGSVLIDEYKEVAVGEEIQEYDDIRHENGITKIRTGQVVAPWREEILGSARPEFDDVVRDGFRYGGPTIEADNHGCLSEGLAENCIEEVRNSAALFAWIDGVETIGTIAEIGAAYAYGKPIFVAFANEALADQFYFAKQLATIAIDTSKPTTAWKLFCQWQRNSARET
jgi:hypothetical protein